jgi:hypothetical protein
MNWHEIRNLVRYAMFTSMVAAMLLGYVITSAQVGLRTASKALVAPATVAAPGKVFQFPGRAENVPQGHYWYLGKIHKGGNQRQGGDFGMVRLDPETKKWTKLKLGVSKAEHEANPKNENSIIYGQPVYAPADGEIFVCWRNAPENAKPGVKDPRVGTTIPSGGNSLWIKYGENDWGLLAHAIPGSIPAKLCPVNQALKSSADSKEGLVPENQRAKVKTGDFLMRVGNSGQSSGTHLHYHRDSTGPKLLQGQGDDEPDDDGPGGVVGTEFVPISMSAAADASLPSPYSGAWLKSAENPSVSTSGWVRANGTLLTSPPTLILPDYSKGLGEIARHGVPAADYQFVFDHVTKSGYFPSWVDGYEVNGKNYYNVIFRPADGIARGARHGLNGTQYQTEYDDFKAKGLRLVHVDSYPDGNSIRYTALFAKDNGPLVAAYHGIAADEHQKRFDERTKSGWRPKVISVVSLNGQRFYTALYEKTPVGNLEARSFLTPAEYQQEYNDNKAAGRQIVYLNAYEHSGQTRFTAIFRAPSNGSTKARHGISSSEYQQEWNEAVKAGFRTQAVAGYEAGGQTRIAAFWRK